jgi:tetratricopeptide (TPR) repeat protein
MVDRLTRRIETDPDHASSYYWRAVYSVTLGDMQRVLKDLKKSADIETKPATTAQRYDVAAWILVGRHQEMINPEIAVELYSEAHKMQPKDWRYLRGLGAAYYRMGRWDEAITTLTKSTKLVDGENALNYLLLAMAHWQLGDKATAANCYDEAVEWIKSRDIVWYTNRAQMIYDIYLEASELMGIGTREF